MRSKSRTIFVDVNARDPRQSTSAHAFYPQITGLKLITPRHRNGCRRQALSVRPGKLRDGRVKSIVPGSSGVTFAHKIAMSDENDGILGNLPRSRPGVRSEKRSSGGAAGGPGGSAGSPPAPKARAKAGPGPKAAARPGPRKPAASRPAKPPPQASERSADPIGMALKAGETMALTGLKVTGKVAGEVIRRLRRP
jgi:hypothetical protein